MKFPYGVSDFYKIATENYVFVDRTAYISALESIGGVLRLRTYVIVALGFERLVWEEVS